VVGLVYLPARSLIESELNQLVVVDCEVVLLVFPMWLVSFYVWLDVVLVRFLGPMIMCQ
jgi:hypothetical protein